MGLKADWEEALQNKQLAGVSDIVGGIHPDKPQKKKVRERNGVSEALNQQVCSSLSTLLFIA